jgi:transcriptional regulator NrdR family protein
MLCPNCKYPNSSVVYVEHNDKNDLTTRRRSCLKCGLRFTTTEHIKERKVKKDYLKRNDDTSAMSK